MYYLKFSHVSYNLFSILFRCGGTTHTHTPPTNGFSSHYTIYIQAYTYKRTFILTAYVWCVYRPRASNVWFNNNTTTTMHIYIYVLRTPDILRMHTHAVPLGRTKWHRSTTTFTRDNLTHHKQSAFFPHARVHALIYARSSSIRLMYINS